MSSDFSDAAISGFIKDANIDNLISSIIDTNTEQEVRDGMLQILQNNIQALFVSNRDRAAAYFAQNIMEKVLDSYLRQTISSQQVAQQLKLKEVFQNAFREDFDIQDFIAARDSVVKKHCDKISDQDFVDNVVRLIHANQILQTGEDSRNNNIDIFKSAVIAYMQHQNFNRDNFQYLLSIFDSLEVTKSHDLFFDAFQIDRVQLEEWLQSPQSYTALQANIEFQKEHVSHEGAFSYQSSMDGIVNYARRGFDVSVITERLCDEFSFGSVDIVGTNKEILEEFFYENSIAVPARYATILNPFSLKNISQKDETFFQIKNLNKQDFELIIEKEYPDFNNPFAEDRTRSEVGSSGAEEDHADAPVTLVRPEVRASHLPPNPLTSVAPPEDDLRRMLEDAGVSTEEINANLTVMSPSTPPVAVGGASPYVDALANPVRPEVRASHLPPNPLTSMAPPEDNLRMMLEGAGVSAEEIDANLAAMSPSTPPVAVGGGFAPEAPLSGFDLAVRDPIYLASDGVSSYLRSAAAIGKCSEADYTQISADGSSAYVVNPAISAQFTNYPELLGGMIGGSIAESKAKNPGATKISINWPLSEREHWKFVSVEIDKSDPANITCVISQLDTDGFKSQCSNDALNRQLQSNLEVIYPGCQIERLTERQQVCPALQINQNCGFVAAVIDAVNKEKFFGNLEGVPSLKESLEIYTRSLGVELELKEDLVSDIELALGFIDQINNDTYLFTDASNAAINRGDGLLRSVIVDTFLESPKVPEEEKRKFMDSLRLDYFRCRDKEIDVSQDPRYNARSVVMEGGGTRPPSRSPSPSSSVSLGGDLSTNHFRG